MLDIKRIDHFAITTRDRKSAEAFYLKIGFEQVLKIERATFFKAGDAIIALFPANEGAKDGKARGAMDLNTIAFQHLAFRVENGTLEHWQAKLEEAGIPTTGPKEHELNRSIYFEDPDGNQLELTHPFDGLSRNCTS